MKNKRTISLVILSMLTALILIFALTPIGYIPFGAMKITAIHIPVIVGGILLGPLYGAILGMVFGLTSFGLAPTDPVFAAILAKSPIMMLAICVIPRILVGVVAGYSAKLFNKIDKTQIFSSGISAALATVTNTVLVLGSIYAFYGNLAAQILDTVLKQTGKTIALFLVSIGITNGIPEIIAAFIIVPIVVKAVKKLNII